MTLTRAAIGWLDDADPGEPSTGKPRLSVSDTEAKILGALAAGKRVFEIGTGLGVSTRAMAARAMAVVTEDIDPWVAEHIAPDLARLGNVTCIRSRDTHELRLVDMVFIDGDHTTAHVAADIEFARTLNPTLIVCHDANYPNVRSALDDSWTILPTEHGLAFA